MQNRVNSERVELIAFMLLFLLVSIGFFWLLKPFFTAIFWSSAITIIFHPLQKKLLARFPSQKTISALLTLLFFMVIVILPLSFLLNSAVGESVVLYKKLEADEINPGRLIEQFHSAFPSVEHGLNRIGIDLNLLKKHITDGALNVGKFIAQNSLSLGQNLFSFLLNLGLVLYLTFFMLRDGNKMIGTIMRAFPMGEAREQLLFSKFVEVTRATVKGNLLVALVQGALGGIMFYLLGIQGALLWGLIMVIAAMVPLIGPALIWLPASLYLLSAGEFWKATLLVMFGIAVIGLVDNLLRPILVGRDTKLPDYLILLSTLGGLALFGMNGFVVGPLIAALFIVFWDIFKREINTYTPN